MTDKTTEQASGLTPGGSCRPERDELHTQLEQPRRSPFVDEHVAKSLRDDKRAARAAGYPKVWNSGCACASKSQHAPWCPEAPEASFTMPIEQVEAELREMGIDPDEVQRRAEETLAAHGIAVGHHDCYEFKGEPWEATVRAADGFPADPREYRFPTNDELRQVVEPPYVQTWRDKMESDRLEIERLTLQVENDDAVIKDLHARREHQCLYVLRMEEDAERRSQLEAGLRDHIRRLEEELSKQPEDAASFPNWELDKKALLAKVEMQQHLIDVCQKRNSDLYAVIDAYREAVTAMAKELRASGEYALAHERSVKATYDAETLCSKVVRLVGEEND